MRIFYLARINAALEDASTRHVLEVCRHWALAGHDVVLFVPDLGEARRHLTGVRLVYVPVIFKKFSLTYFSFYFVLFFWFVYHFLRARPGVVYTRHQHMEWVVAWLRFVLGFKYVAEVNGLFHVEAEFNGVSPRWIRFCRAMSALSFKIANGMVTPTQQIKEGLCRAYRLNADAIHVVSNGANKDLFQPMDKQECRQRLGLDPEMNYLIFVGSLKAWHGAGTIISLFPELEREVGRVRLLIVGSGEEEESYRQLIQQNGLEDKVALLGKMKFEDIPATICASDIGLAPYFDAPHRITGRSPKATFSYMCPIKVFEYMACGCPVLCSAGTGLDGLIQSTQSGELVSADHPQEWVRAISDMLNDPEKMKACGANGRKAVVETYNWDRISRTLVETMSSLS